MATLLLELFSEEIPARMQRKAAEQLGETLSAAFAAEGLAPDTLRTFVTPRRLAALVTGLPAMQPDVTEERKGPKTGAPEAAIQGFLKSTGLALAQLEKRMAGKDECYFAVVHKKGQPTAEALKKILPELLQGFAWPKSMRWGAHAFAWVRPLHHICCLLDDQVVPFDFHHLRADNLIFGHRFLAPQPIVLTHAEDYEEKLRSAFVIADADARKLTIRRALQTLADSKHLHLGEDERLLEEVTGLVEWPVALMGRMDDDIMHLPPEVLVTVMKQHQRYFPLYTSNHHLSSSFLLISNMKTADEGRAVVAGNERVLRARFADGKFFYEQDQKTPLQDWAQKLGSVVFHARLGSVAEKVERVRALAEAIAPYILLSSVPPSSLPPQAGGVTKESPPLAGGSKRGNLVSLASRAAALCKADLVTGMVGEFAELQGVMGRYYALAQGEAEAVAEAIRDHYSPLGPNDACPTAPVSACIALADKLDTLISMFAIGEKPTGSKDPFALRRAALGAIRILLENEIRLPLTNVIPAGGELLAFFHDRLKVVLKDRGIRHDVIAAVLMKKNAQDSGARPGGRGRVEDTRADEVCLPPARPIADSGESAGGNEKEDDLVRLVARAEALQAFLATGDGANLLAAYRRAANIVKIESAKDAKEYMDAPSPALLRQTEEKALADALENVERTTAPLIQSERFTDAMASLATLRAPVDAFFDRVLVNAEEPDLRENRLKLLAHMQSTMDRLADFSVVEGGDTSRKAA